MKLWINIILSIFFATQAMAQTGDSSQNVLDDVVVQTRYEGNFEEDKLPLSVKFDYSQEAVVGEKISWTSLAAIEPEPDQGEVAANVVVLHHSFPQYAQIRPNPVKSFRVNFDKLQRWQLDITAGDGSLVRSLSAEGTPPESIGWDGFSTSGEPLKVGANYAYSFTAVDKAGNKRTFPGESFTVSAFMLQKGDTLMVGLSRKAIFSEDGLRILPQANEYIRETASLIRYYLNSPTVKVETAYPAGDKFLSSLTEMLVVQDGFFTRVPTTQTREAGIVFYLENVGEKAGTEADGE